MAKFQKGVSGNPGGRPKADPEVKKLAQRHTAEAIRVLAKIMKDEKAPPTARAMASNSLLDRGHGKAVQQIDANYSRKPMADMSDEELEAVINAEAEREKATAH